MGYDLEGKIKMKTMKDYIYDLIKNEIFYDDDLNSWWESHNFENVSLASVDKTNHVLILIYSDNTMQTLDLDSLDMFEYNYELTCETTII